MSIVNKQTTTQLNMHTHSPQTYTDTHTTHISTTQTNYHTVPGQLYSLKTIPSFL